MKIKPAIALGLRDWLELGQALADISNLGPKYFTKWQSFSIRIGGKGNKIRANNKWFKTGIYYLDENVK